MKTANSKLYNSATFYDHLLKMPIETLIQDVKAGILDLNKRFESNKDTIWHVLANSKDERHARVVSTLVQTFYNSIDFTLLKSVNDENLAPIHIAAIRGNLEMIRTLISFGVDPTAPCPSQVRHYATPLDFIKQEGHVRLITEIEALIKLYQQHVEIESQPVQTSNKEYKLPCGNKYRTWMQKSSLHLRKQAKAECEEPLLDKETEAFHKKLA